MSELTKMKLNKTEREILNELAKIEAIAENELYTNYITKRLAQLDAKVSNKKPKELSELELQAIEQITETLTREDYIPIAQIIDETELLDGNRKFFTSSRVTSLVKGIVGIDIAKKGKGNIYKMKGDEVSN